MNNFEKKIVIFINQHRWKKIDALSRLLSSVTFLVFLWIAIAIFVVFSNLFVGISICIALAIVFTLHFAISEGLLKLGGKLFSFERVRPYIAYPGDIVPIGKNFLSSSFPSCHVSAMVGGLVVLTYFYIFLWPAAVFLALLTGWSRIRNGMHYPSDVLAGIILGLMYGYLALMLV
jgi:undecaprenyl-diphosphatase